MQQFIDKLISRLEEEKDRANRHYNYGDETAYHRSIEIVNQLAEEYKGGWIPCSERLPEVGVAVLCFCKFGNYWVAKYGGADSEHLGNKDIWFIHNLGWLRKDSVLAWMPLPSPYQKEGE